MGVLTDDSERMKRIINQSIKSNGNNGMKKLIRLMGEIIYFLLLSVPLALTIYIGLHIGLLFYIIYKKIK